MPDRWLNLIEVNAIKTRDPHMNWSVDQLYRIVYTVLFHFKIDSKSPSSFRTVSIHESLTKTMLLKVVDTSTISSLNGDMVTRLKELIILKI